MCQKKYRNYKLENTHQDIQKRYNKLIYTLATQHDKDRSVQMLLNKADSNRIVLVKNPIEQGFGYNVNKGEEIGLCMVNYKTGSINKADDIFFVLLHELAHVMTTSYSHDDEFYKNLNFLKQVATENGIFVMTDYENNPSQFCNGYISKSQ